MATSSWGLRGTLEFVRVICLCSNLYTYKASACKRTIIRLHCATSKSSLWNMEYVARGGAFEHPHIYCTNVHVPGRPPYDFNVYTLVHVDFPVNLPSVPSVLWQKRDSMCLSLTLTVTGVFTSEVLCHTADDCLAS